MAKRKVLLTGAGGRIGPHLVPAFQEAYDLRTFDRQPVPGDPDAVLGDLQDVNALRTAMEGREVVVHLAATSDEAPFLESLVPNNVIGLYNTFQAALDAGVRRIVYASTVQTIAHNPPERRVEIDDPPRPITMYAATKVFGEVLGRWYHDTHGLEFVGIRIGAFQPYDSPLLSQYPAFRDLWLSPGDARRLLRRAIDTEDVGYTLVFGTSITARERVSLDSARARLGYAPEDDITALLERGEQRP